MMFYIVIVCFTVPIWGPVLLWLLTKIEQWTCNHTWENGSSDPYGDGWHWWKQCSKCNKLVDREMPPFVKKMEEDIDRLER